MTISEGPKRVCIINKSKLKLDEKDDLHCESFCFEHKIMLINLVKVTFPAQRRKPSTKKKEEEIKGQETTKTL